jgi:hypothetical protein
VLCPVQADFRELPAHPATTSEFKQFEFFDLTGSYWRGGTIPGILYAKALQERRCNMSKGAMPEQILMQDTSSYIALRQRAERGRARPARLFDD